MKLSAKLFIVGVLALTAFGVGAQAAWASFSGGAAAQYAETWWNSYNSGYQNFPGADCTNYVSQCFDHGGLDQTDQWYNNLGRMPWDYTSSTWNNADDFWDYFKNHARYNRVYIGTFDYFDGGHPQPQRNLDGWGRGGVVGYDFNCIANGSEPQYPFVDHLAICVLSPGSSQGNPNWPNMPWSGDLTDQHTDSQYHRAWNRGDQHPASWLARERWQYYVFYLPSNAY